MRNGARTATSSDTTRDRRCFACRLQYFSAAMSKARAARQLPKSWPEDVPYLTNPAYSKAVAPDVLRTTNPKLDLNADVTTVSHTNGPSAVVKIVEIKDPAHPASGQHGLFAAQHLCPDTFILFYLGHVHGSVDADPASDFDLSLDRELGIAVDASKMGNEARFINDFRGVAVSPNAEFRDIWVGIGKGLFEKRMAAYVLPAGKSGKRAKGIAKGEEILVSYGKGFWMERERERHGDTGPPGD